jgi:Leucine-rich repeat (LRR) protein
MGNLITLNLQDNEIEVFHDFIFGQVHKLKTLNVGGNKIKILPDVLLSNNSQLETFIANRNFIETIPVNLFNSTPKIEFINLSNNKIMHIEFDFAKLKHLKKVFGLQNPCADFFLNKNVTALVALLKVNCPPKPIPTTAADRK